MSKMLIPFAVLAVLTTAAQAQSPAPAAPPAATPPAPPAATPPDAAAPPAPAASATPAPGDAGKTASGVGETANQQTYKMKDGGMYQPPAQRPASPARETETYGRT